MSASISATRSSRRSSPRRARSSSTSCPSRRRSTTSSTSTWSARTRPSARSSVAVYNHYKRIQAGDKGRAGDNDGIEIAKSNILMLGPHRLRQDLPGADPGQAAERAVRHRRRHGAHRGGLRRRGRREHPAQAHPGGRLRRQAGRDGHHLHRRGRQDRPQVGEPVDHPRRLRRGRAAGAAEDPGGHHGVGAAAGRAQAPAPGVHPDRHHERAVHRGGRVRGPREDHRRPRGQARARLRRRDPLQARSRHVRELLRDAARGPHQVRADPGVHRAAADRRVGHARSTRTPSSRSSPSRATRW